MEGQKTKKTQQYEKTHNDGTLWAKGTMVDDKLSGYWEWFRKDGSKMRSGYFRDGKQVGDWTTFDKKGNIVKVTNFDLKQSRGKMKP